MDTIWVLKDQLSRRFAMEFERVGFELDYKKANTFEEGFAAHRKRFRPERFHAMGAFFVG